MAGRAGGPCSQSFPPRIFISARHVFLMEIKKPITLQGHLDDRDPIETQEWLESLDDVLQREGPDRVRQLLQRLQIHASERGVSLPISATTPYINSIPLDQQPQFPGSRDIERRIKSLIRWNALGMVVRANRAEEGIGGHISTYASAATLYEVGFNHFFHARTKNHPGDQIFFQGHASPGIYARAYLEGRLTDEHMKNFRRELAPGGGLSSYPHPWLMPNFWNFPTVSMGLGPLMAVYQARFNRYLTDRGLKDLAKSKVWCFVGDGEMDEPESLAAVAVGGREKLENLIFVVNCNLQRLDGPVRGNSKVMQEFEGLYRGAGWNVIKVVWGGDWDALLERDRHGLLVQRMNELVDGEMQKLAIESGEYVRRVFFGKYPELLKMVEHLTDEHLRKLRRGGHDPEKIYAAYKIATETQGKPTCILAATVKGYGLGEAGEGRNITHQQKKLNEEEMREFRTRFGIPISDKELVETPFYRPPDDSPEMRYLHDRRRVLGGYVPQREVKVEPLPAPEEQLFEEFYDGTQDRPVSTTMAYVRILAKLLHHERIGRLIVPIVPAEARTFGMEGLFRQYGIHSHVGQLYEPVDAKSLLYYKEIRDGQILQEGINEAGAMASFVAAGTAYSVHGINMIPFFTYYSMFGFQRIGDLIWAAGDMRCKGFLVGGTAGRTTLNGEGLQHEDGHSHLLAYAVPTLRAYDPAFAYEIAVIIRDGLRRMYEAQEDLFYYITVANENYAQPKMPEGVRDGILNGLYCYRASEKKRPKARAHLLGSGSILNEALKAQALLEDTYGVAADVWSATSYKQLHYDAIGCERWNLLHPDETPRVPCVTRALAERPGVHVASLDYVRALPESIARWVPGQFIALGTDGFGRSETRAALRDFFEVDHRYIALAALSALAREGKVKPETVSKAIRDLQINPEKLNPLVS